MFDHILMQLFFYSEKLLFNKWSFWYLRSQLYKRTKLTNILVLFMIYIFVIFGKQIGLSYYCFTEH